MESVEKMGRYYTAMLQTICGDDYPKVCAAAEKIAVQQSCADFHRKRMESKISIGSNVLKRR